MAGGVGFIVHNLIISKIEMDELTLAYIFFGLIIGYTIMDFGSNIGNSELEIFTQRCFVICVFIITIIVWRRERKCGLFYNLKIKETRLKSVKVAYKY